MRLPQDDLAPVTRLYERLAEALQRTRRDPFNVPVTVAEIYQELVPYRLVRTEIGFDMNADYEHALLRLLAGEGEWVRIEPTHAAEEIRKELHSPNPNLSIYRDYAACDVWVRKPIAGSTVRRGHAPAPAMPGPSLRAPAEPAGPAARSGAGRSATEQKGPARPAAEPTGTAAAPQRASSAADGTASGLRNAPAPRPAPTPAVPREREPPLPGPDWQTPIDLQDIMPAVEGPDSAGFAPPAGEARPGKREEIDDTPPVAVTPMSETSKRKATPAEESAGTVPSGKAGRTPGPQPPPPATPAVPGRASPPPAPGTAKPVTPAAVKPEAARCAFCDSQLPQQRQARFCPYCGADQTTRPCPSCGEPVEPGWAFCITCGATAQ